MTQYTMCPFVLGLFHSAHFCSASPVEKHVRILFMCIHDFFYLLAIVNDEYRCVDLCWGLCLEFFWILSIYLSIIYLSINLLLIYLLSIDHLISYMYHLPIISICQPSMYLITFNVPIIITYNLSLLPIIYYLSVIIIYHLLSSIYWST